MTEAVSEALRDILKAKDDLRLFKSRIHPPQTLYQRVGSLELNALTISGSVRKAAETLRENADGSPEWDGAAEMAYALSVRIEGVARMLRPRENVEIRAGTLKAETESCIRWLANVRRTVKECCKRQGEGV